LNKRYCAYLTFGRDFTIWLIDRPDSLVFLIGKYNKL